MDRRDFLKAATLAGLSVFTPWRRASAQAAPEPYAGPLWIMLNANGGWDPTDLCNPQGKASAASKEGVNSYLTSDIKTAGAIRYAPHPGFDAFFQKYYQRILVINGIDLSTNGHTEGNRHSWTGHLPDGYASLAALIAGTYAPTQPIAYMSSGGFDFTGGVVGATRVGNPDVLQNIAFPNIVRATDEKSDSFHLESTRLRIEAARAARYEAVLAGQRLPRLRRTMGQLHTAGLDSDNLRKVVDYMPKPLSKEVFESQVQIAMAAYRAGVTISMSMGFGSFDTHSNHDQNHIPQLTEMLANIDFLWTEAERQQIADRVVLLVSSEMGRTPHYNSGQGKDHWSITSMMLMGQGITGNRVIGATDSGVQALKVDPKTLAPLDAKSQSGVLITPAHIHTALREKAGVKEDFRRTFIIEPEGGPLPLLA